MPYDFQAELLLKDLILDLYYPDGTYLDADLVASLPKQLCAPLRLWRHGEDLRQMYSATTFKRYRAAFLETLGIDILERVKNAGDQPISASRPWDFIPAPIPDFALGTPLVAPVPEFEGIDYAAQCTFFKGI